MDTEAVIEKMMKIPVSLHCWQGDDVKGFDQDGPLTGGIQTTGCLLYTSSVPAAGPGSPAGFGKG